MPVERRRKTGRADEFAAQRRPIDGWGSCWRCCPRGPRTAVVVVALLYARPPCAPRARARTRLVCRARARIVFAHPVVFPPQRPIKQHPGRYTHVIQKCLPGCRTANIWLKFNSAKPARQICRGRKSVHLILFSQWPLPPVSAVYQGSKSVPAGRCCRTGLKTCPAAGRLALIHIGINQHTHNGPRDQQRPGHQQIVITMIKTLPPATRQILNDSVGIGGLLQGMFRQGGRPRRLTRATLKTSVQRNGGVRNNLHWRDGQRFGKICRYQHGMDMNRA